MEIGEKVALFDFCETIANFQTADAFVRFVQEHSNKTNRLYSILYSTLNRLKYFGIMRRIMPQKNIEKHFILRILKGMSYVELNMFARQYYDKVVKKNMIQPIINELVRLKNEEYRIYLVSAGYDIYLKYFVEDFSVDGLLCTKIAFKEGVCTGCFDGKDCMYDYKVESVKSNIQGDPSNWFAFSDSITDLPLLELVGKPIVVSKRKSQKWAENRNYKQIIW